MQFVNNDMDDMMRRAAENYPLDTGGADWNKVLSAMHDEKKDEPVVPPKDKRGRLLWLLLLLPLGLICNRVFNNGADEETVLNQGVHEITRPSNPAGDQRGTSEDGRTRNNESRSMDIPAEAISDNHIAAGTNNTKQKLNIVDNNNTIQSVPGRIKATPLQEQVGYKNNGGPVNPGKWKEDQPKNTANFYSERKNTPTTSKTNEAGFNRQSSGESRMERTMAEYLRNGNFQKQNRVGTGEDLFNPLPPLFASLIEMNRKTGEKSSTGKKFYAGIMAGIDATTVKFQKVESAGFDYGIQMGYRIHPRWSVEAGAFRDKKIYYSDGKYYNTSGIYLPPNTKITDVSGTCYMWEIPLNVKYDFSTRGKSSWFSTLGISSYIMKKEDYEYVYYYGGSGTSVKHFKTYKNSSRNLFSAVQLSGGYSRKMGKIGDLRIEPYLKIPIANMGYGKLPLMSTGVRVGVTREIF